jgi:hypothetical protein
MLAVVSSVTPTREDDHHDRRAVIRPIWTFAIDQPSGRVTFTLRVELAGYFDFVMM